MRLKFEVGGTVESTCDRCNNPLTLDLWDEFMVTVKSAENPEELNELAEDPDVFFIGRHESHLDLSDWIYEFINLSIPLQKICAEEEPGKIKCNPSALALLKRMENVEEEKPRNEIWKDLEKFNNFDN